METKRLKVHFGDDPTIGELKRLIADLDDNIKIRLADLVVGNVYRPTTIALEDTTEIPGRKMDEVKLTAFIIS